MKITALFLILFSALTHAGIIEINGAATPGVLPLGSFSITGTLPNANLAHSAISINGSSVVLGGSVSGLQTTGGVLELDGFSGITGTLALSRLAVDPLARGNHTGTQLMSTISNAGTLATLSAVGSLQITDGTITAADISNTAGITNAMLAGSIANAKLANSSLTMGTTTVSLGATTTSLQGLAFVQATSFVGTLTGGATTAVALVFARTINGVAFDGSANITVTAAAGTLTGSVLPATISQSSIISFGTGASLSNCVGLPAASVVAGTLGSGGYTFTAASDATPATIVTKNVATGLTLWQIGTLTTDATRSAIYGPNTPSGTNYSLKSSGATTVLNGSTSSIIAVADASKITCSATSTLLAAGTAIIAPLQFTSGTSLTTAASGVIEYNGTSYFATDSTPARKRISMEETVGSNGSPAFNTARQVSGNKGAWVCASVSILTQTNTGDGKIELLIGSNSDGTTGAVTCGTVRALVASANIGTVGIAVGGQLCGYVPAGYYYYLKKTDSGGTTNTFTIVGNVMEYTQ